MAHPFLSLYGTIDSLHGHGMMADNGTLAECGDGYHHVRNTPCCLGTCADNIQPLHLWSQHRRPWGHDRGMDNRQRLQYVTSNIHPNNDELTGQPCWWAPAWPKSSPPSQRPVVPTSGHTCWLHNNMRHFLRGSLAGKPRRPTATTSHSNHIQGSTS